ncbi:hypothetical protein D1Z90_08455 [Motilimonas pumila]|uniref:Phosphatase PAP2 family protein n=2 Tax=Motilimonas pumila TaxID=2303987 RepID=A0A418YFH6_9GAMM|nr:hypothetical protein D1Z90_08455 [Motilimonas pumila]
MEQIGAVLADVYTPLLIAGCITLLIKQYRQSASWRCTLLSVLACAGAYVFMLLDEALSIWPSFGADYSTHTAIAVALVCIIVCMLPAWPLPRRLHTAWRWLTVGSLVAYMVLMKLMHYHTFLDMVTTVLVMLPWLLLTWRRGLVQSKA